MTAPAPRLRINLTLEGAAFEDGAGRPECARILRDIANRIQANNYEDGIYQTIMDENGNDCGRWRLTSPETAWREGL